MNCSSNNHPTTRRLDLLLLILVELILVYNVFEAPFLGMKRPYPYGGLYYIIEVCRLFSLFIHETAFVVLLFSIFLFTYDTRKKNESQRGLSYYITFIFLQVIILMGYMLYDDFSSFIYEVDGPFSCGTHLFSIYMLPRAFIITLLILSLIILYLLYKRRRNGQLLTLKSALLVASTGPIGIGLLFLVYELSSYCSWFFW